MAARVCPQCSNTVPATSVMALTNGMECPHCHTRLEVGNGSRMWAIVAGLLAGHIAWHFTEGGTGLLSGVLPELYAVLAFGIVSPLVLMAIASLQIAPEPVVAAPQDAHGGHGHAPAAHH